MCSYVFFSAPQKLEPFMLGSLGMLCSVPLKTALSKDSIDVEPHKHTFHSKFHFSFNIHNDFLIIVIFK